LANIVINSQKASALLQLQPAVLTHPAAAPVILMFPVFGVAYAGFGFDIIEPDVFSAATVGPGILAGYGTGMTADTLVEIKNQSKLRANFH
jgi:hypothetical protein